MAEDEAIVVNDVADDTAIADPTPAEDNSQEPITADEESTTEEAEESEDETEPQEENAEDEDQPAPVEEETKSKADERKEKLNQEIRDLVQTRNQIRQDVEKANGEAYKPATVDQLLEEVNPETGEYYNRLEAEIATMKQQNAVRDYTNQVAEQRLVIVSEAQKALQDFPIFDAESPEYNKDVAEQVDTILAGAIIRDPRTGQVIGSHVSPYQLYKTVYDSTQASAVKGQVKAQKAQAKMLANSDATQSSGTAKEAKKDNFMQGFDQDY